MEKGNVRLEDRLGFDEDRHGERYWKLQDEVLGRLENALYVLGKPAKRPFGPDCDGHVEHADHQHKSREDRQHQVQEVKT